MDSGFRLTNTFRHQLSVQVGENRERGGGDSLKFSFERFQFSFCLFLLVEGEMVKPEAGSSHMPI
jgi:hypothetical protein